MILYFQTNLKIRLNLLSNEFSNFIFSNRKYEKNLFCIFDSFLCQIYNKM